jgi:hypothetical protein
VATPWSHHAGKRHVRGFTWGNIAVTWWQTYGCIPGGQGVYPRRVQVRETNLKQLVQGEKQFRVPLWQRQYTWRITDHRLLWRDILEQYAHAPDGAAASPSRHFLGSIVLSPASLRRQ